MESLGKHHPPHSGSFFRHRTSRKSSGLTLWLLWWLWWL